MLRPRPIYTCILILAAICGSAVNRCSNLGGGGHFFRISELDVPGTNCIRGPLFNIQGGGAGVFVAGKLFLSTGLGGALKISHFITCLYSS